MRTGFIVACVFGALVWFAPISTKAEVFSVRPQTPYELMPMVLSDKAGEYLGELRDNPITYELVISTTTTASFTLTQLKSPTPAPLRLLIVKTLPTGRVELVARVNEQDNDWKLEDDHWLGMSWWTLPVHEVTLAPGIYRVEVSSALNVESFRLVFGDNVGKVGYSETWKRIADINDFYNRPLAMWLDSWFVLLHILGVFIFYFALRYLRWWWPGVIIICQLLNIGWQRLYARGRLLLQKDN